MDTSTDAVVVGLLAVPATGAPEQLDQRVYVGARQHGERLMPAVLEVVAACGRELFELDAVVCGAGPGPFTGLRVGLVTAAGLGDALGVPVYGVCSLDAIAERVEPGEPLLVISDARRRELYWAAYSGAGRRVSGPAVDTPAALAERVPELGVRRVAGPVASAYAQTLGLAELGLAELGQAELGLAELAGGAPTPAGLVAAAGDALRERREPAALEPLYLRRPDAVVPGERKRASTSAQLSRA